MNSRAAEPGAPLSFRALVMLSPGALLGAALLATVSAALSLVPFFLLYRIAQALAEPAVDVDRVRDYAAWSLVAILARWLVMAASHALAHWGAFSVVFQLRLALVRRLARVPMGFFARRNSGALRKTVLEDTAEMQGFLAHMLPDAVAAASVPTLALALLFAMDWRLALAAVAPLPLSVLLQVLMLRRSSRHMQDWQAVQARIAAHTVEYLRGLAVVKVFGLSAGAFGRLVEAIHDAVRWVERHAAASSAGWAGFVVLLSANLVVVAPVGAWLHARGQIDTATFVLFLLVAPAVLQPLLRLTFAFGEQARRRAALAQINALLQEPGLADPAPAGLPAPDAPHAIEFESVRFSHSPGSGVEALSGVSFVAPAGGVTALVGPSGAGKSTAAWLVRRCFDVTGGRIRVAGVDLRDWPLDALQSRLGIVFQDVMLFHGTVRDNLRMARPDASDEALVAAATAARAHDFIERLPQGYDTPLGERGARLSGGERQRLSIARALLKDAPILLLDEATAHADAENEWLIQQAIDTVSRGRTVLIVAHRLHTVRDADHIVVLDAGRVAGQGTHEALMRDCPLYRHLWQEHEAVLDWSLAGAGHAAGTAEGAGAPPSGARQEARPA